jgi:23S rRNA pseudouridine1911/1915/1917 synthase
VKEFLASETDVQTRLDKVIAAAYPKFTRSSLELLFDRGLVSVNGQEAKPSYKIRQKDKITINDTYLKQKPPTLDMPIIYEDTDIVVIDKPAGILSHSKGALNFEPTVASFVQSKITDKSLDGNRAGIIHRLDRATSGVMITAKNQTALQWLQKQFSQRKTKKIYVGVVEGVPRPPEAIIDAPLGRNPKKPQTFTVLSAGKPAHTRYKVLDEFEVSAKPYSKLELQPLSGRTHQLRVHMSYIGHPIVGDQVYGRKDGPMLLHAKLLELTLPNKQRTVFESKLPKSFEEFIKNAS